MDDEQIITFKVTRVENTDTDTKRITIVIEDTIRLVYHVFPEDDHIKVQSPKYATVLDNALDNRIRSEIRRVYMLGAQWKP